MTPPFSRHRGRTILVITAWLVIAGTVVLAPKASRAFCTTPTHGCSANVVSTHLTTNYHKDGARPSLRGLGNLGSSDDSRGYLLRGINQDTSAPSASAHSIDQANAAGQAYQATQQATDELRPRHNVPTFDYGVGPALIMAIDNTNSMLEGSIKAIQAAAIALVESLRGTEGQPSQYVLTAINDPKVGPVLITPNPDPFEAGIRSLTSPTSPWAGDGGDCPELSMSAALLALSAASDGGRLFVFTDADAKDADLAGALPVWRRLRGSE